ncbi:hypothetical protein FGO68_gene4953 [Halteria grandinella]|uniref:Uncharacterized protein n=1 Tax=Halteria grandinella TaxID=5974 RepID=A0A8J8NME2_HALGN|nr:hypothetical protein FGO68_gene4953 [Halteria grandinella]
MCSRGCDVTEDDSFEFTTKEVIKAAARKLHAIIAQQSDLYFQKEPKFLRLNRRRQKLQAHKMLRKIKSPIFMTPLELNIAMMSVCLAKLPSLKKYESSRNCQDTNGDVTNNSIKINESLTTPFLIYADLIGTPTQFRKRIQGRFLICELTQLIAHKKEHLDKIQKDQNQKDLECQNEGTECRIEIVMKNRGGHRFREQEADPGIHALHGQIR